MKKGFDVVEVHVRRRKNESLKALLIRARKKLQSMAYPEPGEYPWKTKK